MLNVLLLFAALRSMTGATGRSAFVAAFFAVHPLHVEEHLPQLAPLLTAWPAH